LYWYQSEDCSTHGQFAEYLEPDKDVYGWQRVSRDDNLRSLNAKAALVSIAQSRTAGNNGVVYWDDIELNPVDAEREESGDPLFNQEYTLSIGKNYVVNGEFLYSLKSWQSSGDTKWISYQGGDAPGAARLAIFSDQGGLGAHSFSQCINIGANKVFSAGAKVKVDPVSSQKGGGIFRLSWYENIDCHGRNQAGFVEDRVENVDGWQQLLIDRIEAPPGAESASLYFTRGVNDSGLFTYFIDDVYFIAVPDEASPQGRETGD
jgi:hypothetical protein